MAKVDGPLFSLDASGTIGGAIVFSKWKGRNYVRVRVVPSNPKSGAQVGRRSMFSFISQAWGALTTVEKATWETIADALTIAPFNAYTKVNLQRWHNFRSPTQDTPATESGQGSDRDLTAAVWEENRIKISSTAVTENEQWGTALFASLGTGFTPSVGNCIMVIPDDNADPQEVFWTPPSVAEWFFVIRAFSADGVLEAAGTEVTASP